MAAQNLMHSLCLQRAINLPSRTEVHVFFITAQKFMYSLCLQRAINLSSRTEVRVWHSEWCPTALQNEGIRPTKQGKAGKGITDNPYI